MTEPTDAEKLAAAQAALFTAQEAEKAARLPSAQAAADFLNSEEATAFAAELDTLIAGCLDDAPGAAGGCKRALERIAQSFSVAKGIVGQRVIALQPAPPAEPAPEA
jgi:uncharacterized protein (DUF2267 family)